MNTRGEINTGYIIALAITLIVGLVLIVPIGQIQGTLTTLGQKNNQTITLPTNGTTADLNACEQLVVGTAILFNATNGTVGFQGGEIPATNFTISQGIGNNGYPSARIVLSIFAPAQGYYGRPANVTCQYEPFGYNHDSGSRSVAGMILVFMAIAMVAVGLKKDLFEY